MAKSRFISPRKHVAGKDDEPVRFFIPGDCRVMIIRLLFGERDMIFGYAGCTQHQYDLLWEKMQVQ
jgi:hypothetical protein